MTDLPPDLPPVDDTPPGPPATTRGPVPAPLHPGRVDGDR